MSLQCQAPGYYSYSTQVKKEPVNQMRSLLSHGAYLFVENVGRKRNIKTIKVHTGKGTAAH